ncbi:UpxY family transcription antiterminator [Pseudozobellia sp. WGM2]|uniref:UpxY family transcription antiterminator n=1 Tax=Pseudozobellia sp. WGM2 TaxID=2787625 RepID=UPI001FD74620|nr:UpxY family transcription antiterminator [Pseudozobellia sp. WGM2]
MMEQWYVLQVRPGYEKKVAEKLKNLKMEVYCPLLKQVRIWSDRKKTIETPLIRSYVFIRCEEQERTIAFSVPGVVRYLFWLGKPAKVRDEEIRVLKDWMENDTVDAIACSRLQPGAHTTIRKGLWKDQDAIVRHLGRTRVSLVLEDLGIVVNAKLKDVV